MVPLLVMGTSTLVERVWEDLQVSSEGASLSTLERCWNRLPIYKNSTAVSNPLFQVADLSAALAQLHHHQP